jgi:hypothetical protein
MTSEPFSRRHGFGNIVEPPHEDEIPVWTRREVFHRLYLRIYNEFIRVQSRYNYKYIDFNADFYLDIRPRIWATIGTEPPVFTDADLWRLWDSSILSEFFERVEWWEFYDVCESAYTYLKSRLSLNHAVIFSRDANSLFASDFLPWAFNRNGLIERINPPAIAGKLQGTHQLLSDPRFAGPEQQFVKANQHLNERPNPDVENCVKDAVGAVEGVARIVSGQEKATLSQLVRSHFRGQMHQTLLDSMDKVYAYRGDVEGVGHGQTKPSGLTIDEARLVLGLCADYMVYLVSKFAPRSN